MAILAILLTLTDIIGFLHFWGITIDIISCINIVLAIGLCVDYSVHICHAFLVAKVLSWSTKYLITMPTTWSTTYRVLF